MSGGGAPTRPGAAEDHGTHPVGGGGDPAAALAPFLVEPRVVPPLDPRFRPGPAARRRLEALARESGHAVPVALAVEQPDGPVIVREAWIYPDRHPNAAAGHAMALRLVRFALWAQGGARVWVDGPDGLYDAVRRHYEDDPAGRFDARLMGAEVYGRTFEVVRAARADFPPSHESAVALGRHLEGCRIGFDLGASDRKAAAVIDGRVVFSEEVSWDPARHDDPQWHADQVNESLRAAAAHLPRVDAIGGSAAGIYVDSEVRVASIFRGVPRELFERRVRGMFRDLGAAWGVPFAVVNDGQVTALAGAMLAGVGGLLGIALGSSEAAGYVTPDGRLTTRLDELAFAPLDESPGAPGDEWSGERGCGVQYLSQQAVGRLLGPAGIAVDQGSSLPERLVHVQELMAAGDERALRVYETLGTYLGYALLAYREWYDFEHVLLLGRVMTGRGGEVIRDCAREVLRVEEPAAAEAISFHEVSERDKRHGQAVAAASLPAVE
jgi:predicted NBD/HSP70 family sugar kinase